MKKIKMKAYIFTIILYLTVAKIGGSLCFINAFIGVPCFSCGLTRAGYALFFENDIVKAWKLHPLVFIAYGTLVFVIIFHIVMKKESNKSEVIILISFALIFVMVYIIRMINYYPNIYPMVYNDKSILGRLLSVR